MGFFDIYVIRYFRMDRSHAPSRSVIMNDQIMRSYNAVVFFYKSFNLIIYLRIDCFTDQRFQRIFCNADSCPHYNKGNSDSDHSVNVPARNSKNDKRKDRRACCDHISHRIRKHCHHHFRIYLLAKPLVEQTKPQFHSDR